MSLDSPMDKVLERRREVEERLSTSAALTNSDLVQLSRELSDLRPICDQIELVRRIEAELSGALSMADEAVGDADMYEMAQAEVDLLKAQLPEAHSALQLMLLPKDKDDARNAILEVRAGTGGDEAALFAANLFSMYQRFAAKHGWFFEVMEVSETGIGGYKEATATISGNDVFARLKFESGVHRVQRVPETEAGGRIHTSAATVAVLPDELREPSPKALEMPFFRCLLPDGPPRRSQMNPEMIQDDPRRSRAEMDTYDPRWSQMIPHDPRCFQMNPKLIQMIANDLR